MSIKIGMTPSHPGAYIRNWVLPESMIVKEAAEHLGVGRQALDALLNGRAALSPEMALRIEQAFGDSMDGLLRMQLNFDAYAIRARANEIVGSVRPYQAA
jgi:addiction module HigA family antidote